VRLLLDTHIAIWAVSDLTRLGASARALISSDTNDIYVSAVSIGEIAIKRGLGKRFDPPPFSANDATGYFLRAGFEIIPLTSEQAAALEDLPLLHKDPFDRLLIAQALHEPYVLVTSDRTVAAYDKRIRLV
jgi:PIN domain nuclease of toxin-antitoxin system